MINAKKKLSSIVISIFIAFFLSGCKSGEEENCPNTDDAKIGAFGVSQEFVKQRLHDPARAEFGYYGDSDVLVLWEEHCKFHVYAKVRATNAFGAFILTPYSIRVKYLPTKHAFTASNLVMY